MVVVGTTIRLLSRRYAGSFWKRLRALFDSIQRESSPLKRLLRPAKVIIRAFHDTGRHILKRQATKAILIAVINTVR